MRLIESRLPTASGRVVAKPEVWSGTGTKSPVTASLGHARELGSYSGVEIIVIDSEIGPPSEGSAVILVGAVLHSHAKTQAPYAATIPPSLPSTRSAGMVSSRDLPDKAFRYVVCAHIHDRN
jgi:hypothetical protein